MNNKQEFYSNFQCYSKKNQRIAVFGRQLDENTLEIFELTCSKSDQFMKFVAKEAYDIWLNAFNVEVVKDSHYHPNIYNISILQENKPMFTFNEWCKNNYYHKYEGQRKYTETYLYKKGQKKIVLKIVRSNKID